RASENGATGVAAAPKSATPVASVTTINGATSAVAPPTIAAATWITAVAKAAIVAAVRITRAARWAIAAGGQVMPVAVKDRLTTTTAPGRDTVPISAVPSAISSAVPTAASNGRRGNGAARTNAK